ncbi:hypothetical protein [Salmonella phage SSBI34]|nr:hypothetical protein [Salmonella phage SSBI34]
MDIRSNCVCRHPMKEGFHKLQDVLRDLSSGIGANLVYRQCLAIAADYIDHLEKENKLIQIDANCYKHGQDALKKRMLELLDEIDKVKGESGEHKA